MSIKHLLQVSASALLTAAALSGIFWPVLNGNFLERLSHFGAKPLNAVVGLLILLLASGAIWGAGLALIFFVRDVGAAAKAGAKYWGLGSFVFVLLLEGINAFQVLLADALGLSRHALFTIAFVLSTAWLVNWCVKHILPALGSKADVIRSARIGAIMAALAYWLVDRLMFSRGWDLALVYFEGRSVMVTVSLYGITAAALLAGGFLGRTLANE